MNTLFSILLPAYFQRVDATPPSIDLLVSNSYRHTLFFGVRTFGIGNRLRLLDTLRQGDDNKPFTGSRANVRMKSMGVL